ncbi:META domain-containing protein [Lolliginicoccus suaedae]|uniref:META domain-containing protein n=1 Tax=Lolliginicoccus suaedae TaxID=2605429 RepID=UPI001F2546FD|nr:META domain-containing protein [Lolliginicoccus suaedae]
MRSVSRRMISAIASCGVLAGMAVACGSNEEEAPVAGLEGREFISSSVTGTPIPGGGPLRVEFGDDGTLNATAGCNTAFGGVDLSDGRVRTEQLAMTLIGCSEETAGADEWLNGLLAEEPAWELDGEELVLRTEDTTVTLVDREVAEPDQALVGTTWELRSLISEDAVASGPSITDAGATLRIDEEGRVSGSAGCNNIMGSARVDGATVEFSPLATTRMSCSDEKNEVERAVLAVLSEGTVQVTIEADRLTVMGESGNGLEYVAQS